jgi:hypothetical protein
MVGDRYSTFNDKAIETEIRENDEAMLITKQSHVDLARS